MLKKHVSFPYLNVLYQEFLNSHQMQTSKHVSCSLLKPFAAIIPGKFLNI